MENITLLEVARAVGGKIAEEYADTIISAVSTDSRKIPSGSLFVPIKGERFDGHAYIEKALSSGAVAALSERGGSGRIITVEDTRRAYLDLAAWYRRRFPVTVVGVTGSVGKTTTKEMIAAVLESRYRTLKTEGNFNNEIGLPRTLLGLEAADRMAVIEMGMSHFGEISRLSRCAAPNIGVITNIGVSHMENLGSREGILKAKLEILDGMEPNAPLILNADNDLLAGVVDTLEREIIYYGIENEQADIRACNITKSNLSTEFDILYYGKTTHVKLPAVGRHNVLNALAAFAVGLVSDLPAEQMAEALQRYLPAGMRQRIVEKQGRILIEDCYNASPDSMKAALSVLSSLESEGKKIAVLADMLELGTIAKQAHFDVGALAAQSGVDELYCYGELAEEIANGAKSSGLEQAYVYRDKDALAAELRRVSGQGDCVLFKGSRGMRLEEVIEKMNGES